MRYHIFLVFFGALLFATFTLSYSEESRFIYNSSDKRDPFVPYITKDGKMFSVPGVLGEVKLEGIVHDAQGGSTCIINGTVLKEGEQYEDFKVIKINTDSVILLCHNKEFNVEFREVKDNGKKNEKTE
ncbi:MAG: hypothetical protein V1893_04155 [Candidatus Omnitrophota bacterium]